WSRRGNRTLRYICTRDKNLGPGQTPTRALGPLSVWEGVTAPARGLRRSNPCFLDKPVRAGGSREVLCDVCVTGDSTRLPDELLSVHGARTPQLLDHVGVSGEQRLR